VRNEKENIQNDDGSYVVKSNRKSNLVAFILCFLIAFCVWIYVMNIENGDYTKTFALSIEVVGEEELYQKTGLRVFEDSSTVTVANITVQGTKVDVQKYKEQDFRAYIDVSSLTESGKASLGIHVETPTSTVKVISSDPTTIKVNVDYFKRAEVELKIKKSEGIICAPDVSTITVSGPQDYVNQISYVQLVLSDREYELGERVELSDVKVYDEKNKLLSNLNLTFAPKTVTVTIQGVETKND